MEGAAVTSVVKDFMCLMQGMLLGVLCTVWVSQISIYKVHNFVIKEHIMTVIGAGENGI